MNFKNQNIWIIGASSGIGRALAMQLAQKGANLILSARREDELLNIRQQLGFQHKIYTVDVADLTQVQDVCKKISLSDQKLDRVIVLSALYKPDSIANMDLEFMSKMIDVNLKAPIYLTKFILPIFEKQKTGQIIFCGSVAGYTGLPNGQPYSATKAALINFSESLYAEVPAYITVKLISPGFVKTPMTDKNNFKMPMIITPEKAASYIIEGLDSQGFEIHFPKKFTLLLKLLSIMPYGIKLYLTAKMKDKSSYHKNDETKETY